MERIWAPWRLQYYQNKSSCDTCVFCIDEDRSKDKELYVLRRADHAYLMLNKYPFIGGHMLVVPYRHLANVTELTEAEALDMHRLTAMAIRVLQAQLYPDGFNVGTNQGLDGGAGICEHLHQHLVPRWRGDTNFMPLLAEVRVLPQHLDETYELLQPLMASAPLVVEE